MLKRILPLLLALSLLCAPITAFAAQPDARVDIINGGELTPTSPKSQALDAYLDELLAELLVDYPLPAAEEQQPEEEAVAEEESILVFREEEEDEVPEAVEEDPIYTYNQVKICYDYLIANVSYGSHMSNLGAAVGNTTCRSIYSSYGAVEGFGAVALSAKKGMCNAYASAFILMARKIGLNAYLVTGQTRSGRGGYTYHEWAEIQIGEQIYLFDPQLDQSLANQGLGSYTVFCKTYDQVPGRYIRY